MMNNCTNGPDNSRCPTTMTNYAQLFVVNEYYEWNYMALLMLLIKALYIMDTLVWVWLLKKPLCGY